MAERAIDAIGRPKAPARGLLNETICELEKLNRHRFSFTTLGKRTTVVGSLPQYEPFDKKILFRMRHTPLFRAVVRNYSRLLKRQRQNILWYQMSTMSYMQTFIFEKKRGPCQPYYTVWFDAQPTLSPMSALF